MTISPFIFSSKNLPRLKSKQLFKAFPFLKLSAAQELTALALGYSSWHECSHRGSLGEPSLSDQEAGMPTRVVRYYHQANVLMRSGITPSEADRWVRAWGLTGHPTVAPELGRPLYYEWNEDLDKLDRGEIDKDQLAEKFNDSYYSKYPGVEMPERFCTGVILGPMGKYPHYVLDPTVNARIPIYLRGPLSCYHVEDHRDLLTRCVPGFGETSSSEKLMVKLNSVQYEWHYGEKHPHASGLCIPALMELALARPDALIAITQRMMPKADSKYDPDRFAVACLRGRDFATFLREKGVVDSSTVIWYENVDFSDCAALRGFLDGLPHDEISLPVFEAASKYKPSLPLYSYPFMTGPMSGDEYYGRIECVCLLPLNEDYNEANDDDDDEWGDDGDDAPDDQFSPLLGVIPQDLQPA